MAITSTSGFIALLDDKGPEVKSFALQRLNDLVDEFWAEISESVNKIEILQEDANFSSHKLAALLASKVYYHLGEYEDSLHFALCAEELLDINSSSEYIETMLSKCIDKYTLLRVKNDKELTDEPSDNQQDAHAWTSVKSATYKRMEQLVDKMFDRCFALKQYRQVLGIAIETIRLDMFEKAITNSDDPEEMLRYAFRVVLTLSDNVHMRDRLLKILVQIYTSRAAATDSVHLCQCLVLLNDPDATATTLEKLLVDQEESALLAYQIAFDLYENSTQHFLGNVITAIKSSLRLGRFASAAPTPVASEATKTESEEPEKKEEKEEPVVVAQSSEEKELASRVQHLLSILSGDKAIELHLQLLIRNNKADLRVLEKIKEDVRNSVMHNATVLANGIMHCGTTSDQFLRSHLPWLGKAVNWAKFSATATLGVIHRGHEKDALRLMSAYLPKDACGAASSVYTEGGGLFALGLIHAGHGAAIIDYLLAQCREATAEPVRHGACLGLGLAAMGTGREDVYDQVKSNLHLDDAVTGEAAGLAMGLVMLASGSARAVEDLLSYAKETTHEKIVRGIALGIALVMYGKQEEADALIDTLAADSDPILRWCAMATLAMAYCGSGSNRAVKRLLHAAVSDNNDDVRRWALTAIGFLLFKKPEQVPSLVSLLSESYHPHLRYGAAMAVGIACAGTGNKDAIALLDTLIDGTVNFVRQGALISQAMVLMQQNSVTCPKSIEFREKCLKIVGDRHEDFMVKFGAILARSIVDAGGSNMTISLQTRTGNANMATAVGLLVFQNFWFWYPFANFISMALTPTAVIGLNKELRMPKLNFVSNAKPSTFAYPPPLQVEKEKKREKVETAILSITAKHKKKELDKKRDKLAAQLAGSSKEKEETKPKEKEKEKEKEPPTSELENPARVMRAQQRVLTLPEECRYRPLKPICQGGFIMLVDKRPETEEEIVEPVVGHGPVNLKTGATTDLAGKGGAGAGGSGTGEASQVDSDAPTNIHGSELGAFVDADADELDEMMSVDIDEPNAGEDDDEEEALPTDEDEEEEEMELDEEIEDDATTATTTEDEGATGGTAPTTPDASASGGPSAPKRHPRGAAAGSKKASSKQRGEPEPPEPFQYASDHDDDDEASRRTPTPGEASSKPKEEPKK